MYTQDRRKMRQFFVDVWIKHKNNAPMEAIEQIIAKVIELHPEHHALLEDENKALEQDYLPEMGQTNPFLHMSMHIAIHEQLSVDKPTGIRDIYQTLLQKHQDPHDVEHHMMDCLGEMMWQAQRTGGTPNEKLYLKCLKKQCKK